MTILLAVGAACGAVLAIAAVLGLVARRILLPWLREELSAPLQEVKHQVSVNQHSSAQPTVLDKIDDVRAEVRAIGHILDAHLTHAAEMDARLIATERRIK